MKTLKQLACISALTVGVLAAGQHSAYGQIAAPLNQYSSKFACGTAVAKATKTNIYVTMVQPGVYSTSINIHNPALPPPPGTTGGTVTFYKKAVLSVPEGTAQIPPSHLMTDQLAADFSEEVDCAIIRKLLGAAAPAGFIEGWVVIYSEATVSPTGVVTRNPLDVTAVRSDSKGALEFDDAQEDDF